MCEVCVTSFMDGPFRFSRGPVLGLGEVSQFGGQIPELRDVEDVVMVVLEAPDYVILHRAEEALLEEWPETGLRMFV